MSDPKERRPIRPTNLAICMVVAGSLAMSGCVFGSAKKKARVFTPPPIMAKLPPSSEPPVVTETAPLDVPEIEGGEVPTVEPGPMPAAPPKPAPPKVTPPPKPPVTVESQPPTPAPKPTTIFSAEDRRRYTQELDDRLDRVKKVLARAEGRSLSSDLISLANNARSFLLQAEQARSQDLVTAVDLAKRADLFATDLMSRLP